MAANIVIAAPALKKAAGVIIWWRRRDLAPRRLWTALGERFLESLMDESWTEHRLADPLDLEFAP